MNQRVFIAVPLPDFLKSEIHENLLKIKELLPFQKWVVPDDLHITLKFIGEVTSKQLTDIQKSLEMLIPGQSSFHLRADRLGTFGKPYAPSILFYQVGGDTEELNRLHARAEDEMSAVGFPKEDRPFHPHITVARRYNGEKKLDLRKLPDEVTAPSETWHWNADEVVLYESRLGSVPMYQPISRYKLK